MVSGNDMVEERVGRCYILRNTEARLKLSAADVIQTSSHMLTISVLVCINCTLAINLLKY